MSDKQGFRGAVTVTLQGKFRSGAALMPDDGPPYRTLFPGCGPPGSLRNRTQRTLLSLSILGSLWWPSAPGIAAM